MTNIRIDTRARLASLPELFDPQDLSNICQIEMNVAHQYLNRWRQYGLISSLGRTGVHFNIQINPMAKEELLKPALIKALKRNVIQIGTIPLSKSGWFTSFNQDPKTFIVRSEANQQTLPGLEDENIILLKRPEWYFDIINERNDTAMIIADEILSQNIKDDLPPRFDITNPIDFSRFNGDIEPDLLRFRQNSVERRINEIIESSPMKYARSMSNIDIRKIVRSNMVIQDYGEVSLRG